MSRRAIFVLKAVLHLLCLAPFLWLLRQYASGALAENDDPVSFITHFTGDWAVFLLLASLAITPVRRLSPKLAFLVRFRRMVGLYAFFYATLHLATYVFLFSGYDFAAVSEGLRAGHPGAIWEQWRLIWPGIVEDLQQRRFVQVGLFAWTILLALAVTSPARVIRAMGGKNWQRLHWLVYVAALAVVAHFWWQMKPGVYRPWKVTVVLAVLLLARAAYVVMKRSRKSSRAPLRTTRV